jgi:hypothetical protein
VCVEMRGEQKIFSTGSCHEPVLKLWPLKSVLMQPLVWIRSTTGGNARWSQKSKPIFLVVTIEVEFTSEPDLVFV